MSPTAPVNKLVVTIEKKFYDSVTFESGVTIHIDPSWQPQEYAFLTGKVISVPRNISNRPDYKGLNLDGIKPGDSILMRFDVVYSYKNQIDKTTAEFKNLVCLKDGDKYTEYWLCDVQQVFAKLVDNIPQMMNDYIMLRPVIEDRPALSSIIIMPESFSKVKRKDKAIVRAIHPGNPHGLQEGDIVYVDSDVIQEYTIARDNFYIVKYRHVLAAHTSFTESISELAAN